MNKLGFFVSLLAITLLLTPVSAFDPLKKKHLSQRRSSHHRQLKQNRGNIRGHRTNGNKNQAATRLLKKKKKDDKTKYSNPYAADRAKQKSSKKSPKSAKTGDTENVSAAKDSLSPAQVLAAANIVQTCPESVRLTWYYDDVENRDNSIEYDTGLSIQIPVFDAFDGREVGIWQCMFTYMPNNRTMYNCAYSFDYDDTEKAYGSQILTSGSEGYHNTITGGSGRFACAKGVEEVLEDGDNSTTLSLKICSTCATS